jgi:hypothetical protein
MAFERYSRCTLRGKRNAFFIFIVFMVSTASMTFHSRWMQSIHSIHINRKPPSVSAHNLWSRLSYYFNRLSKHPSPSAAHPNLASQSITSHLISATMAIPLKTIHEDSREEWMDNEVHRHYNMPMVAVRAEPRVLMHCNVCRDTASVQKTSVSIDKWVNTEYFIWEMSAGLADSGANPQWTELFEEQYQGKWMQIQSEFESIADLPERFLHKVPVPPFLVAEVRIKTNKFPCHWRLRADTGRHMIDTSFWHLWKSILQQDSFNVGPFDVILKVPSHTPAGEDVVDPWNMSLSNDRHGAASDDFSYLRWDRAYNDSAPLDFTCLGEGAQRDSSPPAGRRRSRSTSAIRELSQRMRDSLFL